MEPSAYETGHATIPILETRDVPKCAHGNIGMIVADGMVFYLGVPLAMET